MKSWIFVVLIMCSLAGFQACKSGNTDATEENKPETETEVTNPDARADEKQAQQAPTTPQESSPAEEQSANPSPKSAGVNMAAFESWLKDFLADWNAWNTAALDKYIHPEYGLFVMNNPGAYTYPSYIRNGAEFYKNFNHHEFRKGVTCSLIAGSIPEYSCDTEGYDKEGCFYITSSHTDIAEWISMMADYDLGNGKREPYFPVAEQIDAMETIEVYETEHSVGFNFAEIGGKWYLMRVDMVDPCSA